MSSSLLSTCPRCPCVSRAFFSRDDAFLAKSQEINEGIFRFQRIGARGAGVQEKAKESRWEGLLGKKRFERFATLFAILLPSSPFLFLSFSVVIMNFVVDVINVD